MIAAGSGVITALGFPGVALWPLVFVGLAGFLAVVARPGTWQALGLGYLYGLGFFAVHIFWITTVIGPIAGVLILVEPLYVAAFAVGASWLVRAAVRLTSGARGRSRAGIVLGALPLALACLWVAQEWLRGAWPFGGFPWGKLAFSQPDSPLAHFLPVVGTAGLSALVVIASWYLLVAVTAGIGSARRGSLRATRAIAGGAAALLVAGALGGALIRLPTDAQAGYASVGGVQGNVPGSGGLELDLERRIILDNHVRATDRLADRLRATGRHVDFVVWPENASDIDPTTNPDAYALITEAARQVSAPVLVGTMTQAPDGRRLNTTFVWDPTRGPVASYAKRHPAPFAEYIPFRSFFRHISTKVDLISVDMAPGRRVGLLRVGKTPVGDLICFEVAYDSLARDAVNAGAQIIATQTNNSNFGYTDESVQQLAMSRIRAMESGRAVVHVSTVGVSAMIEPDGREVARTGHFVPATMLERLPLRTSVTIATRWGAWIDGTLGVLGMLAALGAAVLLGRGRRQGPAASGVAASSPASGAPDEPVAVQAGGPPAREE